MQRHFAIRAFRTLAFSAIATALTVAANRPAAAIPYHGPPDLKLTVDLVTAGTGPKGFDSHVLFANMYGTRAAAEAARLQARYGPAAVAGFFPLMDFTIADVVRMAKRDGVKLPAADNPLSPVKLDRSLYLIGHAPGGHYDVGYMIERLISHKYHHELMADLNRHFSQTRVAAFHSVLGTAIVETSKIAS